ncbi:Dps family protein [Sphingomonas sp. BK580]|uniref:Dps family protein n=1 Tax=Sphingomonas sp. BK580 TaxID=2586972 RepID=UPI00161E9B37|nr:DNA starvation/stationary phase protection protein [Sphingomonas sp. BK580]MBB3693549.1 starvation-inducible DNA-binding protein [Sphingomonas sp. BK580]
MARKDEAQPAYEVEYRTIQEFGKLSDLPLALGENCRRQSVELLNQVLADTMMLRDLYKKHHWQMSGATFYQLHLLLDKHYEAQAELVDVVAERIQALGGISLATPHDVAETTRVERPPRDREDVPTQLSRLLKAHEQVLEFCHAAAKTTAEAGDDGTNDLLVSNVIRTNEPQVWFVGEHLAATTLQRPDAAGGSQAGR